MTRCCMVLKTRPHFSRSSKHDHILHDVAHFARPYFAWSKPRRAPAYMMLANKKRPRKQLQGTIFQARSPNMGSNLSQLSLWVERLTGLRMGVDRASETLTGVEKRCQGTERQDQRDLKTRLNFPFPDFLGEVYSYKLSRGKFEPIFKKLALRAVPYNCFLSKPLFFIAT